jgi:hypothetical protein
MSAPLFTRVGVLFCEAAMKIITLTTTRTTSYQH